MGVWMFLCIVVSLVLWYFIGKEFMHIAEMKGHWEKKYFWWTFLCGFIGVAMVLALPNNSGVDTKPQDNEIPEI